MMWIILGTLVTFWLVYRWLTRFLNHVPRHTDQGPRYDKRDQVLAQDQKKGNL